MKLKYLGTGAAEGVPAIFCHCAVCEYAREHGEKEIRSRSQAIVDDALVIDLGPDTFMHTVQNHLDITEVQHCLITHVHGDHLITDTVFFRQAGMANLKPGTKPLCVYGSKETGEVLRTKENGMITNDGSVRFCELKPFEPKQIGDYTVTALPAYHGTENPFFYMIEKEGKTILYAHDTDVFYEEVWDYLKEKAVYFHLVSLDCTEGVKCNLEYRGHMNFERNVEVKERMLNMGLADEKTVFVSNHFSHNGQATYADAKTYGEKLGFVVSYDGMEVTVS